MVHFILNLECDLKAFPEFALEDCLGNEIGVHCFQMCGRPLLCPNLQVTQYQKAPACFKPKNMTSIEEQGAV